MNAKEEVLREEGDFYFRRNVKNRNINAVEAVRVLGDFLRRNKIEGSKRKILEIGCCSGYNLKWLYDELGLDCYGIEPSIEAIEEGKKIFHKEMITFKRGTIDSMDFESNMFDVVAVGFCLYCVDRELIYRSLAEIDRILKPGGFICIWDFDTKIPYLRANRNNALTPTYKQDIVSMLLSNPSYFLVEKRSYKQEEGIEGWKEIFEMEAQNRVAINILYKEHINNAYIHS